jgi:hypothetical protein
MSFISAAVGMVTGNVVPALVGAGLTFGLGFAACEAYEHAAPWGLQHKRATAEANSRAWEKSSDAWSAAAGGWRASFRAAEGVRKAETTQARAAVDEGEKLCDARVAEARRSSAAIRAIVTKEPRRDPQGCPIRELVDPGSLRDALQAGAARPH